VLNKLEYQSILLSLIIVVGVFLRLYHLYDMPFMHDEFSALFRTRFETFDEVLKIGVQIGDTHPAGIQVFLWWYVQLVGENELWLKLPFVLMGSLSIPLMYKVGKLWFNQNVGLITAAYIATIQYTLTYSVIIRPYISGLFLGLLMVYFWTLLIKGKQTFWVYLGYVSFSALCAYNHHFSLLFVAVVGFTGLFMLKGKQLLGYVLAGLLVFILYLPHLSIFFYQLGQGGLDGWLSKPSPLFPLNYIKYIFHFSIESYCLALVVFGVGALYKWKEKWGVFYKISWLWFLTPLSVGLLYSIYVNPVIQYSMLIFTVPYFFFLAFGWFPQKISSKVIGALVIAVLLVNSVTLIKNRQHYRVLYQTRHLQFLKDIESLSERNQSTVLIANHPRINQFYKDKYQWSFSFVNYLQGVSSNIGLDQVQEMVGNSKTPYFVYGGVAYAAPEIVQMIKEYYPYCIEKKDYYASNLYVFSKEKNEDDLMPYFELKNNFKASQKGWNNVDLLYDAKGGLLKKEKEWGPQIAFNLDAALKHRNDVLDIKVTYSHLEEKALYLVTALKYKDSVINYSVVSSADFIKSSDKKTIYKTIELSGVHLPTKNVEVTTYLWNKDKGDFWLQEYQVQLRQGNPIQYSLYEPILDDYE
jgi:hypothetical protein